MFTLDHHVFLHPKHKTLFLIFVLDRHFRFYLSNTLESQRRVHLEIYFRAWAEKESMEISIGTKKECITNGKVIKNIVLVNERYNKAYSIVQYSAV
jgi:hypothetical protein